jgi:hypothetical protein
MPGSPYTIPLRQDAKPSASKPLSIPHIHIETVKTEIKRLMNIGVITPVLTLLGHLPASSFQRRMGLFVSLLILGD